MDSLQIDKILRENKNTKSIFRGVFPANELPKTVTTYPSLFIVNTDTSDGPGQHWTVIYFPKSRDTEFWDSFGHPPMYFKFNDFIERNSKTITFNSKQIQSNSSTTCGAFCIYFAINRSKGIKMYDIVSRFSNDKKVNEKMIKEFMYKNI